MLSVKHLSLNDFLIQQKNELLSGKLNGQRRINYNVRFVCGNQSADLDSCCSSICCAWLTTYQEYILDPLSSSSSLVIPTMNAKGKDFRTRPELSEAIKDTLNIESLIFLDTIPRILPFEFKGWILVDHNVLDPSLALLYGKNVNVIYDHHRDEKAHNFLKLRLINTSASCASIIIAHFEDLYQIIGDKNKKTFVEISV